MINRFFFLINETEAITIAYQFLVPTNHKHTDTF